MYSVFAAIETVTDDGRMVCLYDDKIWEHIESATDDPSVEVLDLHLVSATTEYDSCVVGLRLHTNAPYRIVSLVPQFASFVQNDVHFDNLFVSFQSIKPTLSQYKKAELKHVTCENLSRIQVRGGDCCYIATVNKYSPEKGDCLRSIRVVPSAVLNFTK